MLIIATCFYKDNCGKVKIFTHCSKTTDTSELIDTVYFRCLTENGTVNPYLRKQDHCILSLDFQVLGKQVKAGPITDSHFPKPS